MPIWSEVELAWRLARPAKNIPWLGVTGTNGKTTTTQMLESILRAAGLRTAAVGNIGRPVMETVLDPEPYDVLAVELSSHQLHWSSSLALHSAAVLNLQADHLEWHGTFADYRAAKARIYTRVSAACVYNVADPVTEAMVEEAEVVEGARAIGFTLGTPGLSMLGVVDDLLVDRAFISQRKDSAVELAKITDVSPLAPHNVENALAAAALARSFGVPAPAGARGPPRCRAGAAQDPDRGRARRRTVRGRLEGHQSRTRRRRPCARSTGWSGSPGGRPRGPTSTIWCVAIPIASGRGRPAGRRPGPDRRFAGQTRTRCAGDCDRRGRN